VDNRWAVVLADSHIDPGHPALRLRRYRAVVAGSRLGQGPVAWGIDLGRPGSHRGRCPAAADNRLGLALAAWDIDPGCPECRRDRCRAQAVGGSR
jgi:hypothetical protein